MLFKSPSNADSEPHNLSATEIFLLPRIEAYARALRLQKAMAVSIRGNKKISVAD